MHLFCFPHRFCVEIKASLSDSLLIVERLFSVSIFTRSEQRHEITFCLSHFHSKKGERKKNKKKKGGGGLLICCLLRAILPKFIFCFVIKKIKEKKMQNKLLFFSFFFFFLFFFFPDHFRVKKGTSVGHFVGP